MNDQIRNNKKESVVPKYSSIYQKYMIIRLKDILQRDKVRFAFKQMQNMKSKEKTIQNQTVRKMEQKTYQVSSEIIRPKLKGEQVFLQNFDVAKSYKKKRNDKINLDQVKQENDDLMESMLLSREIRRKNLENIKQLMQFQGETQKIRHSNTTKTQSTTNCIIYLVMVLFIVLWIIFYDC